MRVSVGFCVLALVACGGNIEPGRSGGGHDAGAPTVDGAVAPPDLAPTTFSDFPTAPTVDTSAPANAATLFQAASGSAAGPCLVEPEPGSLFPRNWLRPRFRFTAPSDQNLFEVRLHADAEANDLVVYTAQSSWTLPAALWSALASHVTDAPITFTVRSAHFDGTKLSAAPSVASRGTFTIAPVAASGSIVYWTTTGGSALKGFMVGEETVHPVLTPPQASTACVGCHSSTPDGTYAAVSASDQAGNGDPARIELRSVDGTAKTPPYISAAAQTLLARTYQEQPSFSRAHWQTGDRVALSMLLVANKWEVVWTDLEAATPTQGTGWDVLARNDGLQAASASFSHDGKSVMYVGASDVSSGVSTALGDVRIVPWNGRKGGSFTPLAGASDPAQNEYYPTFSPDDAMVAFCRLPLMQRSYNNPAAEVWVVSAKGGTPTRLQANDPPACSGRKSPGVTNSWPKWSPEATSAGSKTYYWVTFSSTRSEAGNPQLYVAPVVLDGGEAGTVTTYPALYLWNQPAQENNHTPAWDTLSIPLQ